MHSESPEPAPADSDAWRYVPPAGPLGGGQLPRENDQRGYDKVGVMPAVTNAAPRAWQERPQHAEQPMWAPQPPPGYFVPGQTAGPGYFVPGPVKPPKPAPAWALEPPKPLPYHRMARIDWQVAQWWRPLATLGLALVLTLAGFIVWIIVAEALKAVGWSMSENVDDATRPADLLIMLGPLATLIPVAIGASWWGAGRRSSIHSVTGRFRWGLFGRAARVIVPLYAVLLLGPALLFGGDDLHAPQMSATLVACFVIIVVLTPLQSSGEEYAFRGLGMQGFGTWLKSPVWGVVIPTPFFMLGHGYDWVGQIDIACFALCMGALAWKSGGLELPVLIHASNNTFSFLLAPFVPGSLEQGEVDPWSLVFSLPLLFAVTAGLWFWVSRRYGLRWNQPVTRHPGDQNEPVGRGL